MFKRIVVVAGAPRSGTSWLGQILESSPSAVLRFQPLFAYAFKDVVNADSTREEYARFFEDIYASNDAFLLQTMRKEESAHATFEEATDPEYLAIKMVRYHYLLRRMLRDFENLKVVGIVRHPCGVINSWLRAPREFPKGADQRKEWRFGAYKNQGREEEFFGFYKWKEVAHLYLDLQEQYPDRMRIVQYEGLVYFPVRETLRFFKFVGLPFTQATSAFLETCHATHQEGTYAVFKDKSVAERWRSQLDPYIAREIVQDLVGTRLARFLV